MADRKINRGIRQRGTLYRTNSSKAEMDQLEKSLTKEEAERLTEAGHIQGFKGSRDPEEVDTRRATLDHNNEPIRAQGVTKTKKGEPKPASETPNPFAKSKNEEADKKD